MESKKLKNNNIKFRPEGFGEFYWADSREYRGNFR